MWYVQPAKSQISKLLEYSIIVKLLTDHHLEFPSLKGGCTGWSESTLVKMQRCWKSLHVAALNYTVFTSYFFKLSHDMTRFPTI